VIFARVAAGIAGAALIVMVIASAIKTVILPRAAGSLIARRVFGGVRVVMLALAGPKRPYDFRDRVWAYYAPVSLVLLPVAWVTLVVVGFTGIFWSLGDTSVRQAFLISGSSVLTLGVAFRAALPHAALTFVEATLGLGLVSLMISYLPTMYGSFNRREQLVGQLEVRAGLPPSPAELLVRYQRIGWLDGIDQELFSRWEDWFADVEESHSSLPAVAFFRSPVPERSWITAAGCVLDTAALAASVIDRANAPQAAILIRSGAFALRRVATFFKIGYNPDPRPDDPISVSRRDFDLICTELHAAGIPLKPDRDQAWRDFAGWRVNYDAVLVGLADLVIAPPSRWLGERMEHGRSHG
jgi:hypothetical protein